MKYSATTVMLPELTLPQQAQLLGRLGFDGVELRVRRVDDELRKQPPSFWGYHRNDITPENFKSMSSEISTVLKDHGLALAGVASAANCLDLEQICLLLEGCVAAGAPFMRVGAADGYNGNQPYHEIYEQTVEGFGNVLDLTKGSGVKVVLEIHGGTICPSASLAYRIVSNFDAQQIGVIYDPQNMVRDGFETTGLAMELLGPYLAHCHVGGHRPEPDGKDAAGTVSWSWPGCPMAEGLYHYPSMLEGLKRIGFEGFVSIEDFRPGSAEEKLADALAYLKSIHMAS